MLLVNRPLLTRTKRSTACTERGGALVELSFVLPVLVFIMTAVLSTGRMITQYAWMNQVAFQAYLAGSEVWGGLDDASPERLQRRDLMVARASQLTTGTDDLSNTSNTFSGGTLADDENSNNMITVAFSGSLQTILGPISSLNLFARITGPVLAPQPANISALATFDNPGTLFDCQGLATGTAGTTCLINTCSTTGNCDCPIGNICGR